MTDNGSQSSVRKFYKYRCWSTHTRSILVDNRIYFASPFGFTDPFDCGISVICAGEKNQLVFESDAIKNVRAAFPDMSEAETYEAAKYIGDILTTEHLDKATELFREKVHRDITRLCGICCVSEVNYDILMWSHYADCHQGVCVEFSVNEGEPPFGDLRPVRYCDEFPSVDLYDLVSNEDLRKTAPWMLTKSKAWAYEKEWRALDFTSGPGPKSFDSAAITGVIMGYRMSPETKKEVCSVVKTMSSAVTLHDAQMATNRFKLEIVPV